MGEHCSYPIAVVIVALLSHLRRGTAWHFIYPTFYVSHHKSTDIKKPVEITQQGSFNEVLGDGWTLLMTHRCRDIRPTIALKEGNCVALCLSYAKAVIAV